MQGKKLKLFWQQTINSKAKIDEKQVNWEPIINYKTKNKVAIDVKNLSMSYKTAFKSKKEIFNNLNFKIYEDEITALIGSNGVGKTTIVDIISGIKKQTSGEVIYSKDIGSNNEIGVQFQDLSFPKSLSVKDMLDFQLSLSKDIDPIEFNEMIEIFRLKELLKVSISKLSGGQQQRLNVIISLMNKPKVVFLDEFTTGLDISIKNEIKNFIVKFCKQNKIAVVLISHDIDIIDELVNHFILIANKQIIVDSSRNEIIKKHKTISKFLNFYIR